MPTLSVEQFVTSTAPLLDLERAAEVTTAQASTESAVLNNSLLVDELCCTSCGHIPGSCNAMASAG